MTFLMSNQAWDALSDDQQNIIMESVEESKKGHKEYMVTFNNDAIQDMVSNYGLIFTESLDDGEFTRNARLISISCIKLKINLYANQRYISPMYCGNELKDGPFKKKYSPFLVT
jgi:hypothetical protein